VNELFDIDLSIQPSKVFLYTNENYSHINNKIDLDENGALKEFKQFSSYMHAKYTKSLEKFRQFDNKIVEELRDVEKLKAIDVDYDSDVYLDLFHYM
jgi:hypothetical protein